MNGKRSYLSLITMLLPSELADSVHSQQYPSAVVI